MTNNGQENEIARILSSKAAAPPPAIENSEAEAMLSYQQQQLDEVFMREFRAYAEQAFQPFMDLAKAAQDAGPDSALTRSMEALARGRPVLPAQSSDLTAFGRTGASVEILPGALCRPPVVEGPPYTTGSGRMEGPPATGPSSVFRTFSSLTRPDLGRLSVGVANGNLGALGTYPSSAGWLFGDANSVLANILHVAPVAGGPFAVPASVHVSVDVRAGQSTAPFPYDLFEGGPGSTGNGLVGVLGTMYLEVYGANPIGEVPRRTSNVFLRAWKSVSGTSESTIFPLSFSMSQSLGLGPGAAWVAANIAVRLLAFRAGVDDPGGGFSGIDLRDPDEITPGIWFLRPAGGPIRISNLTMTFCPLEFIPVNGITP